MDAREKYINSWLKKSEEEFLVICGMAGSGKSTLAQYIVYSNLQNFESISIVEHIGRKCKEPQDIRKLQEQLCNDLLKGKDRRIPSVCQGTPQIEVLLEKRKSLIVLDDIVKESQLDDLLGSAIINKESKIIITTDNDISNWFKLKSKRFHKYEMKLLNDVESLRLLSLHAFQSEVPPDGFEELAKRVVRYCAGYPLALEVLGSSLSKDNSIQSWESALKLLGNDIHKEIFEVLKRSYDSLPYDSVKELFLHIACFFVGKDMDYVVKILEPDYSAEAKIKILTKRCFLYVTSSNKLMMHRLLQDMAISLVDQESRNLAERSRLWRNEDSYNMLRRGKSSEVIRGLTLDMDLLMEEDKFKSIKFKQLSTDSLRQMDQLKLLKLNFVELTGSYQDSSKHLRWLCWFGFNKSTIYSDIYMGNMVALDMSYSRLKEFEPPTVLKSLKYLNFKDSHDLLEIRNINQIPNLESLILWNCRSLVRVCRTIENLERLAIFNMKGCEKLFKEQIYTLGEIRASTLGGGSTQQPFFPLPHSLQRLYLNNCYLKCTDYFPLSFIIQSYLQYLNLSTGLFEFLPSYNRLRELRVLDLSFCLRLKSLLCVPCTLAELYVYYCKSIEKITFESGQFALQEFGYKGCINLSEIQSLIKLVPVTKLDETDLGHMLWLKEYENHDVNLTGDDDLTQDRSCRLQMLYEFNAMSTSLPDINHPKLTSEYSSESTSLAFDVPMCESSRRLKGLNVTFKYSISGEDCEFFCKISVTNCDDLMYNPKVFGKPASGEVGIWLSYWPIGNTLDVGDEVKVFIVAMSGLEVLTCGASLVYTDDDVADETIENSMRWVESLDLSGFQLISGAYYLCRRDFYQLMEVGRLTSGWFNMLVGDHINPTEIRGWRMTGRPRQSYQSFTELKTISFVMRDPETEEINYNITKMLESSFVGITSNIQDETLKYGTSSDFSGVATKSEKMEVDRHSQKLSLDNELIRLAHILSMEAHEHHQQYYVTNNKKHGVGSSSLSMDVLIFAFPGSWEVNDWYDDESFGETDIDQTLFPSLLRIGENKLARVNKAFLQKFQDLLNNSGFKSEVEKVVKEDKKILFTGHSAGGATASLATLWMLDEFRRKKKLKVPIGCVTFGSPLIGDKTLTHVVRREKWSGHFTHFVLENDIVPRITLTPKTSIQEHLPNILKNFQQKVNPTTTPKSKFPIIFTSKRNTDNDQLVKPDEAVAFFGNVLINVSAVASHDVFDITEPTSVLKEELSVVKLSPYRPFGDYVFCTRDESQGPRQQLVVENPNAVLQLLFYFLWLPNEDQDLAEIAANSLAESLSYEAELNKNGWQLDNKFYLKELNKHLLTSTGSSNDVVRTSSNALFKLTERKKWCLLAVEDDEVRKKENEDQIKKSMKKYKSSKSEQKFIEDILEEIRKYKLKCNDRKIDYYEAFKLQEKGDDFVANVKRLEMANIWDVVVEMVVRKDLPDEFEVWDELVNLATEFRYLVEPLDIANYYRHAKGDGYMGVRPKRYKFSPRWYEHANVMKFEVVSESNFVAEVEELIKEIDEPKNTTLEMVKEEFEMLEKKVQKWNSDVTKTDVFWGKSILAVLQEKLSR